MAGKATEQLFGTTWVHVFEEDSSEGAVYRPEQDDIPLSRSRVSGFLLEPNGAARMLIPGPDDRYVEEPAKWSKEQGGPCDSRLHWKAVATDCSPIAVASDCQNAAAARLLIVPKAAAKITPIRGKRAGQAASTGQTLPAGAPCAADASSAHLQRSILRSQIVKVEWQPCWCHMKSSKPARLARCSR
jgi:hypothetical protein